MAGKTLKTASNVDLLTELVRRRVKHPDDVKVEVNDSERSRMLVVDVNREVDKEGHGDVGLVFGKRFSFINSLNMVISNIKDPTSNRRIIEVSVKKDSKSKSKSKSK